MITTVKKQSSSEERGTDPDQKTSKCFVFVKTLFILALIFAGASAALFHYDIEPKEFLSRIQQSRLYEKLPELME